MTNGPAPVNRFDIPCSLEGIAAWEAEIERFVADMTHDDERVYMITLSIVEVLTNIVEHGFNEVRAPADRIQVSMYKACDEIHVTVTDNASVPPVGVVNQLSTTYAHMPALDTHLEELPVSGWGLNIISSIASSIRFEPLVGGNRLELTFPIRDEASRARRASR